jgi:flagellar motor switch protein FliM
VTTSASTATAARRRGKNLGPVPYDFRRPIKLSREHVRILQLAFETFARSAGTLLTNRLRVESQLTLLAIEQLTYDEYVAMLNNPTVLCTFAADPLPGSMLFDFSLSTAMASIDHLLGGPGGVQPDRPLTDVELPLLRSLVERVLAELRYGFEALADIRPRLGAIDYSAQFVRAMAPSDAVVVASLEMKVGAQDCVASVCLPFTSIFPLLHKDEQEQLSSSERLARQSSFQRLSGSLALAPIEMAVRFDGVKMRTADILGLRPGDVVPLGHPTTRPLAITVNGATLAHAVPGNQGARLACLVVPSPKEETSS